MKSLCLHFYGYKKCFELYLCGHLLSHVFFSKLGNSQFWGQKASTVEVIGNFCIFIGHLQKHCLVIGHLESKLSLHWLTPTPARILVGSIKAQHYVNSRNDKFGRASRQGLLNIKWDCEGVGPDWPLFIGRTLSSGLKFQLLCILKVNIYFYTKVHEF